MLTREVSRNAVLAFTAFLAGTWAAMAHAVCYFTVMEVSSFGLGVAFAHNFKGATHGVCTVGVTGGPVASPAMDRLTMQPE